MTDEKLFDSLDGLFAYDTGCTDSGIHDEALRQEVIGYLRSLSESDLRIKLSTFVRDYYLSDKALEQGYGIEDVAKFLQWLSERMGIQL